MTRFIFAVAIGLLAGFWEAFVTPFFPAAFAIRPLLPSVVILVIASNRARALPAAIAGAALIDAFQPSGTDVAVLRYPLIVLFADVLSRHLLTNRSLYGAVALVLIGRLAERTTSWFVVTAMRLAGLTPYSWSAASSFTFSLFWDAVIVAVGFVFVAMLTKRFYAFASQNRNA